MELCRVWARGKSSDTHWMDGPTVERMAEEGGRKTEDGGEEWSSGVME
jgi:hypothetical protein